MDGYSNSSRSLTGSLTKLTWNLAEGNIQKLKRMMIGKEAAYIPLVVLSPAAQSEVLLVVSGKNEGKEMSMS